MRHGQSYGKNRKKIGLCLLAALRCTKRSVSVRLLVAIITKGLCLGLLAVGFTPHQVAAADSAAQLSDPSRSFSAHEVAAALLTPSLNAPRRACPGSQYVFNLNAQLVYVRFLDRCCLQYGTRVHNQSGESIEE
jgi:hypothetical protein